MRLNPCLEKVDSAGLRNSLSVWYLQNIIKKAKYPLQIGDLVKFLDKEDRANSIVKEGIKAIKNWRGYTHSNGWEEVRKAIARYWFKDDKKFSNIIVTNGATGATYLLSWAIKPKKVAVPLYSYPTWFTSVYKEGGKIVSLDRNKKNQINSNSISKIDKNIDYVVIIPFDNPTGSIIKNENIKKVIKKLKDIRKRCGKTIPLILDMEYYDLVFEKKPENARKPYMDLGKEWIIIYTWSLSKSIGGPEWRAGFLAIDYPKKLEEEGKKLSNALSIMNSDSLGINISAQFMIKGVMEDLIKKGEVFKKREKVRKKVAGRVLKNYNELRKIKEFEFLKRPECAFYSIIKIRNSRPWKSLELKKKIWEKFHKESVKKGKKKLWEKTFEEEGWKYYSLSEIYALDLAIESSIIVVPYGRFNIKEDKENIGFRVVIPQKEEMIKKCRVEWEKFHKKRFKN